MMSSLAGEPLEEVAAEGVCGDVWLEVLIALWPSESESRVKLWIE